MEREPTTFAIVPAGRMGMALSVPLLDNGHRVSLYVRSPKAAEELNNTGRSESKFPQATFPNAHLTGDFIATSDLRTAVESTEVVIFAAPSDAAREVFQHVMDAVGKRDKPPIIVSATKGLLKTPDGSKLISQGLAAMDPSLPDRYAALSGPNFAGEIFKRMHTATNVASTNEKVRLMLQDAFSTEHFRVYTTPDVIGTEMTGALKNVVAMAAGIWEGAKLHDTGRAMVIFYGLHEMRKIGKVLGANEQTIMELAGIGDTYMSATSSQSRNHAVGVALGRGESVDSLANGGTTREGLRTIGLVLEIVEKHGLEVPIMQTVGQTVRKEISVRQALEQLQEAILSPLDPSA